MEIWLRVNGNVTLETRHWADCAAAQRSSTVSKSINNCVIAWFGAHFSPRFADV